MGDLISRQAAIDALDCISGVEEVLRSLPSAQPESCEDASSIYAIMKDYYFEHKDEHDASWQGGFGKCMNLIPNVFEKQQKMEPCADAVSREDVINFLCDWICAPGERCVSTCKCLKGIRELTSVMPVKGYCRDCYYFTYDPISECTVCFKDDYAPMDRDDFCSKWEKKDG